MVVGGQRQAPAALYPRGKDPELKNVGSEFTERYFYFRPRHFRKKGFKL
jgi:hypothetical protein